MLTLALNTKQSIKISIKIYIALGII